MGILAAPLRPWLACRVLQRPPWDVYPADGLRACRCRTSSSLLRMSMMNPG
eukprot:CAMPEP_0117665180 /NCGR_PEP_ID=MMETSP0804-20121206/9663_1 /TAXON_ID=1074897 /ORGANISM="Tetraselmis astigmatica, Strain CCMP880" /LENGTH=50 /DNA_ID=CAMNT_0005472557 /DNA_START=44 /DNA_END=192 /DNA_ORIENTATION=+